MKKLLILILAVCSTAISMVYAQRLVKGQVGIEAGLGWVASRQISQKNFTSWISIISNKSNGKYIMYRAEFDRKTYINDSYEIPVDQFLGKVIYNFSILTDPQKTVSLNIGVGGVAGYSLINNSQYVLPSGAVIQNRSGVVYGASTTSSIELFITDYLILFVRGNVDILFGHSVSRFTPTAGAGIRIIL